jgi:hypothetical protein
VYTRRVTDRRTGYTTIPKLERDLARHGTAQLTGGRYPATIARAGLSYFECWTDRAPFVYGRPGRTIQEALDNLEAAVCEAEAQRRAS